MNYLTAIIGSSGQADMSEGVIIESSVSVGRTDISSISNWYSLIGVRPNFKTEIRKDFKYVRNEIKLLRQQIGYNNLTLEERIICNKCFVSGVEYNNADVSIEDQNTYFYSYKENMNNSRVARDLSVSAYLFKLVFTGQISKVNIDLAVKDSQPYREIYLRDGIEGINYGDTQKGIINFVAEDLPNYNGFTQSMIDNIIDIYVNGNY